MAKVNSSSFHIGADGCFHTRAMESHNAPKYKAKEPTEKMIKKAEQRESDAEVCRRCTKDVCRGSARCIAKQRALQERERMKENGKLFDQIKTCDGSCTCAVDFGGYILGYARDILRLECMDANCGLGRGFCRDLRRNHSHGYGLPDSV